MKKLTLFSILTLLATSFSFSQNWEEISNDFSVNFYTVCSNAEQHFDTVDTSIKGSGYKQFLRWKHDNEYKYYPSGNRSNVDPYFVKNQFEQFQQTSSSPKSLFPSGWNELGPTSPGQITGHYAFGMGRIVSFYVDPNNAQRLYIGTRTGGFWKSINGGTTWSGGSTDFLAASGVSTVAVSPTNPDSILININNSQNHFTHGIYRSIDGGDNWTLSNFNPTNLGWGGLGSYSRIYKIKYHPTIPNLIFIGTNNGIYRSDDNLATWTVPVVNDDFTDIDFHPTDPNIVYAYAQNDPNNVFVSTDAGLTFTATAIPGSTGSVGTVAVSTVCPNCVYYMSNNGLWKSTDNGVSFLLVSNPGQSDAGFAVSDLDDTKMMAGYVDAFASSDGGLNFNQVTYWSLGNTNGAGSGNQNSYNTSTDYIHADLQAAECINGIFYAVTDGFLVSSSDNCVSWNILSEDVGIRMNYNLGVSQSNHDRTICGSQDNGTSVNTENGWVEMYGADGMEGFIHPLNDDWMIGSLQFGGRLRTLDAGQSNDGVTPPGQSGYWIAPIFYDPNEQMRVYSLGENVHLSEDFGSTWATLGSPSFSGQIKYATIAENNSNLIIAVSNEYIELSNDGGVTWTNIQGSLPSYSITDIAFDPNDDNTVIVTYARYQNDNSKVFITHDLGATWQNITYNLGNMPARSVVIDHTDSSTIYVGTEIGVYKKSMTDITWSLYNTALPNTSINELEIMWGSNTLRATTWGRGLWEYSIDGRLNYPAITLTDITNPPTETVPKESVDQFVSATIEYDNAISSAYIEWSIGTPTFGNVIPMSNVSGNDWISDTPLPDYPQGTKMFFKVFAVGNNSDTTETYKFMYTVKPFEFCPAAGYNDGSNLRLTNVTIANVNNSSANDTYTYYGNEVVYLNPGNTYSITLTGSTSWSDNDYGAWIDFNHNNDFDANEAILYEINPGASIVTANFTIPANAALEDTLILRTRLAYWSSTMINPCDTTLGEVEDYPVWISCAPLSSTDIQTACSPYTWIDGNAYTASNNTATFTQTNAFGCDSIITLDLTISNSITLTDVQSSCTPYTWIDGNTYTASNNTASVTLTNTAGCDSTITLDLTINTSSTGTDIQSSCTAYTWIDGNTYTASNNTATFTLTNAAGCDSIVTLDLTINTSNTGTDVQSACNSYAWIDGNTYTASNNTATFTLTNAAGCDSIVTLDLTINAVNAIITESGIDLTASPAGSIYQWIDCGNANQPIQGATNQLFTPTVNGSYAVIITQNNCIDTSNCVTVNSVNLGELTTSNFKLYPNPNNGVFTIELNNSNESFTVAVIDNHGRVVRKYKDVTSEKLNITLDEPSGSYFLVIDGSNVKEVIEFIIE